MRRHKYGPTPRSLADRFWAKVDKNGPVPSDPSLGPCWLWTGAKSGRDYKIDGKGYGVVAVDVDGAMKGAHVVAFYLEHGRWPQKGRYACHRCNVTLCVRPSHLYEGTPRDNMRQCSSEGRHRVRKPSIQQETRIAIVQLYVRGDYTFAALAKLFRVSTSSISAIVRESEQRVKEDGVEVQLPSAPPPTVVDLTA